jgi:NADPH:quinone reductase-like Zn-dependent oxidoreductase
MPADALEIQNAAPVDEEDAAHSQKTKSKRRFAFVLWVRTSCLITRRSGLKGSPNGVEGVFDTVGGESRERSWQLLREGAALASLLPPPPDPATAERYGVQAFMVYGHPNVVEIMPEMTRRLQEGELAFPEIAKTYPLTDAPAAHEDFEHSSPRGCLVLIA